MPAPPVSTPRIQPPSALRLQQAIDLVATSCRAQGIALAIDASELPAGAWTPQAGPQPGPPMTTGFATDAVAPHHETRRRPGDVVRGADPGGRPWLGVSVLGHRRQPIGSLVAFGEDIDQAALIDGASVVASLVEGRRERDRMEDQLHAAEEARAALEEFAFAAAHDLMAPSRKLVALCKILEDDLGDGLSAQVSMDLDFVLEEAERMHRLTDGLLRIARIGSERIEMEPIDLGACARDAADSLMVPIAEQGTRVDIADDLPQVRGNRVLVTQLLQNLLANAIKFASPMDPLVAVTCDRSGPRPIVSVEDNGPGVPDGLLERVFEPFVRGPRPKVGVGAQEVSTGLGLAIAARVVQRHRGRIWVESPRRQRTRFRFELGT